MTVKAPAVLGTALVAAMFLVAGCGSTSAGGANATQVSASSFCKGATALPGYTNGPAPLPGGATSLSGAGSTFIAPMLSTWTSAYHAKTGVQVAYQSIGSGGGVKQIQAGTVDFGESDAYMKDSDLQLAKGPILQIPMVLAPVVVTYHLPGVASGIHFDGETLGKIFAGKITKWNDPALVSLNPGTSLPGLAIAVAHRSDGSGTTDIWTDYLTKQSPTWVAALGGAAQSRGKTVAWPVGIGGKGNEGVSAAVNQTVGAIGYVELGYALQQQLPFGDVKNRAGNFIEPCIATVEAATQGVQYPGDLRFDLTDQPGQEAYPITGTTWALVYKDQTDQAKAVALLDFFSWVLTTGQDQTIAVNYAPLGKDLQQRSIAQLKTMVSNRQPLG